jgi:hypothetical protein
MTDFGPSAWAGGAIAGGQGYVFVRHAGKGRRFSALHVVPAPAGATGATAPTLCGRVSPHGWEPVAADPPGADGDPGWCYICSARLVDALQDAVDELLASRDLEGDWAQPSLRPMQGGRR